ncbi:MAG: hypothetical protein ACTSU5_10535 [Promethearchaeota archaeon]
MAQVIAELRQKYEREHERAEEGARRAEKYARRAEKYARKLRDLGVDPDKI